MGAIDGDCDGCLTVLLARAQRVRNQIISYNDTSQASVRGKYEEALAILLDYDMLHGMSHIEYGRWTASLWSILSRQAHSRSLNMECMNASNSMIAGIRNAPY